MLVRAPLVAKGHRVLVVEDDPNAASILAEIVVALGDGARVAANVEEALAAIAEEDFCYLLIDQELPTGAGGTPLIGGGERVMSALRGSDNRRHDGTWHVTPIIVVTGFAGDHDFVSRMYDAGGDAFFLKPILPNVAKLREKIATVLARAKRTEHAACAAFALAADRGGAAVSPAAPPPELRLVLDGVTTAGRTSFLANTVRRELQHAKYGVFVRFVAAHVTSPGAMSPKASLGLARSRDATTIIRRAFDGLLPEGFELIEGDRSGSFRLNPRVVVERVDWDAMTKHPDAVVQKVGLEMVRRLGRGKQ